jgi:hypothetical protein
MERRGLSREDQGEVDRSARERLRPCGSCDEISDERRRADQREALTGAKAKLAGERRPGPPQDFAVSGNRRAPVTQVLPVQHP